MDELVLSQRFADACAEPSDIYEHLGTFVQAVYDLEATKIIELGVRYGISTLAWIYALYSQDMGHLWAVDTSWPFYVEKDVVKTNLLDPQGPLGVVPYWTFILGSDTDQYVLDALPHSVDIVFIDTNHIYEDTLIELALYAPRVRPGGRIYLHDTAVEVTGNDPDNPVRFPVRTAISEFCGARGLRWLDNPRCYGLGTIYID